MDIQLSDKQQEIYNFFIKSFGSRTKGNENNIKKIILTTTNLIDEMKNKGDLDRESIKDNLLNCQSNLGILYDILDKIRPANEQDLLNDPKCIYFILILYYHWCESLCYIFREFISKNCNPNYVTKDDVNKWLRDNSRKMITLNEIKSIITQKNKNKEAITLQDFLSVFFHRYKSYSKELFQDRVIPPLRNAIAHNKVKIDSNEKMIKFYEPAKKKYLKMKFVKVVDMHDTFTIIYFCIVKELLELFN